MTFFSFRVSNLRPVRQVHPASDAILSTTRK